MYDIIIINQVSQIGRFVFFTKQKTKSKRRRDRASLHNIMDMDY